MEWLKCLPTCAVRIENPDAADCELHAVEKLLSADK